jgi:hypothetical protein
VAKGTGGAEGKEESERERFGEILRESIMKERGILFTPENHRAILDSRKWMTRRVVNPQPDLTEKCGISWKGHLYGAAISGGIEATLRNFSNSKACPYGKKGDRLYIKEGVIIDKAFDPPELAGYYMDGSRATLPNQKRLTAMFMAKKYARTWLGLTDVRVERLQDISEEDAIAEGIMPFGREFTFNGGLHLSRTAKESYAALWDSINRKKHPYEENSWVWVLEFTKI